MKLLLIRHGESVNNLLKRYTGQSDVPLTALGRQQAEEIRPVLACIPFERVYSSDLCRAVDTQKLALPGFTAIQTPLLREIDVGSIAGLPFHPTAMAKRTDGENWEMVAQRLKKFLSQLESDPCGYVAAFCHGGILKTMLELVLETPYAKGNVINDNCNICVFEFDGTRWKLLAWNYGCKV